MHINTTNTSGVNTLDHEVLTSIAEMVAIGRCRDLFECTWQTDSGFKVTVSTADNANYNEHFMFVNILCVYRRKDDLGNIEIFDPPLDIAYFTIDNKNIDRVSSIGIMRLGHSAVEEYIEKIKFLIKDRGFNGDCSDAEAVINIIYGGVK